MMHSLLLPILTIVGIVHSEVSNGPLVYPSWPPKSSHQKPMLHHHIQSQPQHRLHALPQMRMNPSTPSRYPPSPLVHSSSNMVYAQTKHRHYQTHTSVAPPPKHTLSAQHPTNRIVMRPQSAKTHHPSISGGGHSYVMSSLKPFHTAHHQQIATNTASQNIYYKPPPHQGSSSAMVKTSYNSLKNSPHKTTSDYVFENPFGNDVASLLPTLSAINGNHLVEKQPNSLVLTPTPSTLQPITGGQHHNHEIPQYQLQTAFKSLPQFQSNHHKSNYNPIHTIAAPDLSLLEQKPLANYISRPIEMNQISEKDLVGLFNAQQRPYSVHQYQVTEPSHDHTHRENLAGQQTMYALETDTPNHSFQLQQTPDTLTNTNYAQVYNYQPSASALVPHKVFPSFSNNAPTTGALINSQFQKPKQPHIVYQHQPDMPMAAYNPTYLVTQSNHLLNQHKQHLFKPDPLFMQQSHNSGRLPADTEFLPSYQLEPQIATADPIVQYQNEQISQPLDEPQFARLIAAAPIRPHQTSATQQQSHYNPKNEHINTRPKHSSVLQQRPTLTENEMSNLLNFGRLDGNAAHQNPNAAAGFVASSYMQTINTSSGTSLYTNPSYETVLQHQQQNDERIVEATRQAMLNNQKQQSLQHNQSPPAHGQQHHPTIFVTKSPDQKRHDDVEMASPPHRDNKESVGSDLHIYVPDSLDYTADHSETFHKRSDDHHFDEYNNDHSGQTVTDDLKSEAETTDIVATTEYSVVGTVTIGESALKNETTNNPLQVKD